MQNLAGITRHMPNPRAQHSLLASLILFLLFLCTLSVKAEQTALINDHQLLDRQPAIGLIIDDLGYTYERDRKAIALPGPVGYAFLPHTPYAIELANLAHSLGKEVLLHQPMQAMDDNNEPYLGLGALTLDMGKDEFIFTLQNNINSIPHVIGVNNHMGSLLTQHPGHMSWLMEVISENEDLFFVDSFTANSSVVQKIANENWVLNIRRDVFLDHHRDPAHIKRQFDYLLQTARQNGIALGIAHPYPETLKVLEQQLPRLREKGYRLLPISQLLNTHSRRYKTWRAFLSPWHRAVKN